MVSRIELMTYLEKLMGAAAINDYCPNGLQVEGAASISRVIGGVTASQALIDQAVELQADAVLVHHGYFWKGENACLTGMKKQRIQALLQNNINLIAYHLPLDVHAEYGNNVGLAGRLNFEVEGRITVSGVDDLLWYGHLPESMSADALEHHIHTRLQRQPQRVSPVSDKPIQRVAWCTGGAQGYIEQAKELGADAFISGEISEQTYHQAHELDIHYFAAGHHATERYGVQLLGQHLESQFDLDFEYIELPNPV